MYIYTSHSHFTAAIICNPWHKPNILLVPTSLSRGQSMGGDLQVPPEIRSTPAEVTPIVQM